MYCLYIMIFTSCNFLPFIVWLSISIGIKDTIIIPGRVLFPLFVELVIRKSLRPSLLMIVWSKPKMICPPKSPSLKVFSSFNSASILLLIDSLVSPAENPCSFSFHPGAGLYSKTLAIFPNRVLRVGLL